MIRVGLISDTHGLLRPEALAFLRGCDAIIHAGDIGNPGILERLSVLAPVTTVRGNNDVGDWADALNETELLHFGHVRIQVIHDLARMTIDPAAAGIRIVIAGHSHKPAIVEKCGVQYINPGSAGPRRFRLPISIGELRIDGTSAVAHLTQLAVA